MKHEAINEIGKGLIAFANLFTALSIINIYLKEENINFFAILLTIYTFISLYYVGYLIL
jgi:hypothetical protein